MASLFKVEIAKGELAPALTFVEPEEAWQRLGDYVLGRSLLVTNRADWTPEQIVIASRIQSRNENIFRDLPPQQNLWVAGMRRTPGTVAAMRFRWFQGHLESGGQMSEREPAPCPRSVGHPACRAC
jgi:hypothetical protein